ncbi:hypothetical protein AVEN_171541-1 [Araneus ventricosus]|uniref:C2H2-type domain-containing protein n=1 Tax=Araneus ventricosus TaxID=182803 RepID=A0A4Y2R4R4_ARAVE|nr:hypothetical protein AVEN_171541-1 [Araneus ventricosus]
MYQCDKLRLTGFGTKNSTNAIHHWTGTTEALTPPASTPNEPCRFVGLLSSPVSLPRGPALRRLQVQVDGWAARVVVGGEGRLKLGGGGTRLGQSDSCDICQKVFSRRDNLTRHRKIHEDQKVFICNICQKKFGRKDVLNRHKKTHGKNELVAHNNCQKSSGGASNSNRQRNTPSSTSVHICEFCNKSFSRKSCLLQHTRIEHGFKRKHESSPCTNKRAKKMKHALDVFTKHELFHSDKVSKDLKEYIKEMRPRVYNLLSHELDVLNSIKWYMVVTMEMSRMISDDEEKTITTHFRSNCDTVLTLDFVWENIDKGFDKITNSFEEFIRRGSGWTLKKIIKFNLCVAKYRPLRASSYIPLPAKLEKKKAILNIQSTDQNCFIWCLLAHQMNISRENNPQRVNHYIPHQNKIKVGNVTCPVSLNQVPVIERLNELRINVYGYEDNMVFPLYISKQSNPDCINLLLISQEEHRHYCLIRNMSRLLGDLTEHKAATHICFRCLHRFSQKKYLDDHRRFCDNHTPQRTKMPKESNKYLSFNNHHFQHRLPFIIYADFEALILPIGGASPSADNSYTEKVAKHLPCGYAYIIIGPDGKTYKPIVHYRGENTVEHFLNAIVKEKYELAQKICTIAPLHMTPEQEQLFQREKKLLSLQERTTWG